VRRTVLCREANTVLCLRCFRCCCWCTDLFLFLLNALYWRYLCVCYLFGANYVVLLYVSGRALGSAVGVVRAFVCLLLKLRVCVFAVSICLV
jgi:hypothetical protein